MPYSVKQFPPKWYIDGVTNPNAFNGRINLFPTEEEAITFMRKLSAAERATAIFGNGSVETAAMLLVTDQQARDRVRAFLDEVEAAEGNQPPQEAP